MQAAQDRQLLGEEQDNFYCILKSDSRSANVTAALLLPLNKELEACTRPFFEDAMQGPLLPDSETLTLSLSKRGWLSNCDPVHTTTQSSVLVAGGFC